MEIKCEMWECFGSRKDMYYMGDDVLMFRLYCVFGIARSNYGLGLEKAYKLALCKQVGRYICRCQAESHINKKKYNF